jgi:hypothetical protein
MNKASLLKRIKTFQATALFSLIFALAGFSYNVWRLEVSEYNSNTRTASFEILKQLAELEQIIYLAHYDKNSNDGNPRRGWTKVILIEDLSRISNPAVALESENLKSVWQQNWQQMDKDPQAVSQIVEAIEALRLELKTLLLSLN